jgi:hypothetical protein
MNGGEVVEAAFETEVRTRQENLIRIMAWHRDARVNSAWSGDAPFQEGAAARSVSTAF